MRSKPAAAATVASTSRTVDEGVRTGLGASAIAAALIDNLRCLQARTPQHATRHDWYMALAYTVRDRLLDHCLTTVEAISDTDGTLDGANIEIRDAVGHANFFLFGLMAEEVGARKASGYEPRSVYESNPALREALDQIADGFFSNGDCDLFRPLVDSLVPRDDYLLLTDYQAYVDCQESAGQVYRDARRWTSMSLLNAARVGRFSSDRSIREYCRAIWHVSPISTGEP